MAKDKNKDMSKETTEDWNLRELGRNYNLELGYYTMVDKNEAFYAGDQWRGVQSAGLPTPVFNLFKRVINWFISTIMSQKTTVQYAPDDSPEETDIEEEQETNDYAKAVTGHGKDIWDKLKMDNMLVDTLLDAALAGDGYIYTYWDTEKETGKKKGGIVNERIDGVNVYFGNPNERNIQKQPYIIIEFRDMVKNLQKEAQKYDIKDWEKITGDTDNTYQAGNLSTIELTEQQSSGKTNAIIKFWPENDKIMARKSTKNSYVRETWDTKLTRYPIAGMNWDTRKNSYRGRAVGTGIIPNQIFINKLFAMSMLSLSQTAFPRIIYDKHKLAGLTNAVGSMYAVNGSTLDVIREVRGADMSSQALQFIDTCMGMTKDMLGASDAALGDVKPENTSAIIAVTRQAAIPLETVKRRLWDLVEDVGLNMLEQMAAFYGKRKVSSIVNGKRTIVELEFGKLKTIKMNTKVDVGESSYWSELANIQTLDNLLDRQIITPIQYLERLPQGFITNKQGLIDEMTQGRELPPELEQFMSELDPRVQEKINAMGEGAAEHLQGMMMLRQQNPQGYEEHIREMMAA